MLVGLLVIAGAIYFTLLPSRKAVSPAAPPPLAPERGAVAPPSAPKRPSEPATPAPAPVQGIPAATPPAARSSLRVVALSPTNRTFNYPDAPIEVEFSRPVDPDTVPPAFKVHPPVEGTFAWPAPNKLVFTPRRLWKRGATYLVALEDGITDANSPDRLQATSWEFSTVGGYFYTRDIRPLVNAHCAPCHRADGPAAGVSLDTLADIKRFVQLGDADRSRVLTVLTDPNHQGKLPPQFLARVYLLRDWIAAFQAGD